VLFFGKWVLKDCIFTAAMLSLTDLPPEILSAIATFVGGEYLRDQTERLLLCKAWFDSHIYKVTLV
jgi:hypothetical protein